MAWRTKIGERQRCLACGPLRGFTLVELLVVMAIVATLLAIAVPRYIGSVDSAREAALKSTLARMREAIDQYHADRGSYPATLEALVQAGYLRAVPQDPFTESSATWILIAPSAEGQGGAGVYDVQSGAAGASRTGQDLRRW